MRLVDALNQVKDETSSVETYYVCPMCEVMYFSREFALDCCPIQVDTIYYCTKCDEFYHSLTEAELCKHGVK